MEAKTLECGHLNPENNRSLQGLLVIFVGVIFNLLQPIEKVSDCGLKQMDWNYFEEPYHQYSPSLTGVVARTDY
jgi:hypothetical protein